MLDFPRVFKELSSQSAAKDAQYIKEVWKDFWICLVSREASILARREVLTGKAKFGIVGDGKEVPQVALARAFKKGDFKCGYYRDQTFMMALGICSIEDYFAQLYADQANDRFSSGRQMNNHFCTPFIDQNGHWNDLNDAYNISADVSSTASQMARALGHALGSKLLKKNPALQDVELPNHKESSVTVVTIGDASTSEGVFWETLNAAAVMKVPLATCVWDDGYGISVPVELQTVKGSISKALEGFYRDEAGNGIRIFVVKGWDYANLVATFEAGIEKMRQTFNPSLFHIQELTQPQGHSTSGSHERYKSKDRLAWEQEFDCIKKMEEWMIENSLASASEIELLKEQAKKYVKSCKQNAWENFQAPIKVAKNQLVELLLESNIPEDIKAKASHELKLLIDPTMGELLKIARHASIQAEVLSLGKNSKLTDWINFNIKVYGESYHSNLVESSNNLTNEEPAIIDGLNSMNGYQILNQYFDQLFQNDGRVVAFGEDVGHIGDVNQGMAHLQEKYGESRIFDTGIREWTIVGQAMGLAMRGFRPIAEIQYLDYITYALSPLSDEIATLRYRTNGRQIAPVIIRTRGHRLEGIWHAGSPLGMLIHSLRGMHICVPRDMTRAIGMYNTLLSSNDPGLVIECLNGYRLKEYLPSNLATYKVPLGKPEILQNGFDITLVTYGSCVRVALEALQLLKDYTITIEIIDVQTLLPFDIDHMICTSLKKTNKLLILDEDVPGGATSFMMQQILEVQGGYQFIDSKPTTITAAAHRTPFGSDGDYFSKPQAEDVASKIIKVMHEYQQFEAKLY